MLAYFNVIMQESQQLNKPKFFYRASSGQRVVAAIVCFGIIVFFAVFALAGHYKVDCSVIAASSSEPACRARAVE
jgi:hypothetical protein